jgi:hypothetical protein
VDNEFALSAVSAGVGGDDVETLKGALNRQLVFGGLSGLDIGGVMSKRLPF